MKRYKSQISIKIDQVKNRGHTQAQLGMKRKHKYRCCRNIFKSYENFMTMLFQNAFENLGEMDKFYTIINKIIKLIQEKIQNLNGSVNIKEI